MNTVALIIGWTVMTAGGLGIALAVLSWCWDKFVICTKIGDTIRKVFVRLSNEGAFKWQRKSHNVAPIVIAFAMLASVASAASSEPRVYVNGNNRQAIEQMQRECLCRGAIGGVLATMLVAALLMARTHQEER